MRDLLDPLDEALERLSDAELAALYVSVLDLKERVEALDDAVSLVAGSLGAGESW